jgi:hypothetical protein
VLFAVGYRWASYTNFNPLAAALTLTVFGVVLVALAIPLGG